MPKTHKRSMKMKYILVCIISLFVSLSARADSQGEVDRLILKMSSSNLSEASYNEILKEITTKENARDAQRLKAKEFVKRNKDWGSCEATCYHNRNTCFDAGGDAYLCDRLYDRCVSSCDKSAMNKSANKERNCNEKMCYDIRNHCFDRGKPASVCDPLYDACMAGQPDC